MLERTGARWGGGGGGGEQLGATRGELLMVTLEAISVDLLKVEKAVRNLPRITEVEGEERETSLGGPASEGLPLSAEFYNS